MQLLSPLTSADFKDKSNIVISKVEIDSDGAGTYLGLPDVIDFSISTNIENQVGRLCSYSFSMTVLNTDNQFHPYNTGSSYYDYLRQGRRIKLYTGLKVGETEKDFQQILGRIDDYRLSERAGQDICTITGRCLMRIITEYRLYPPDTYWGTSQLYNTFANKIRYDMPADDELGCKGVYKVELDYTNKDGTALEEIFENSDWSYDWHNNQLIFTPRRIPDFAGETNLKVYYMTTQTVEDVVGHILYVAGIFADTDKRDNWIANASYVTPTSKTIDRVWFNTGTSALEAIRLLSEVVQYRLYFDYEGKPVFKPKAGIGSSVGTILKSDMTVENVEENEEETYTHIIVIGEERDRILGEDEIAPAVPSGLTLSTGLGLPTQASLAWIKAEWEANTESDFGHYELRIRKTAYSDFTEVSTIDITFIWYGLEPGIEYGVQIRAVDIYNNRSDWSSEEIIVTATDETTPAQTTGAVATALLTGIKVIWDRSTEDNIAGYIVERQESENGVTWVGAWSERVRTDATMWLDLLLTYTMYYRYKIKAFTQAGVEGVASSPTANSIKPNKAGTNDIVANAITADLIAANSIYTNALQAGAITASKIAAYAIETDKIKAGAITAVKIATGTITTTQLNFVPVKSTDVIARINASAEGIDIQADNIAISGLTTFASGYNPTGKIATAGAAADVNTYTTTINGGKITTNSITANKINVTSLAAIESTLGTVHAGTIYGTRLRVGGGTNEDIYFEDSGIRMFDYGGNRILFYKSAGYADFGIILSSSLLQLSAGGQLALLSSTGVINLQCLSRAFYFRSGGTLQLPVLTSQPTAHSGDLALECSGSGDGDNRMHYYSPYVGWQYFDDNAGW